MIAEAVLTDGTAALLLPLRREDREALREGYEQLSTVTRYHRFLASVPHLSSTLLDHVGKPVGVARMIRYEQQPTAADVAVTVLDEWQGRGVATALLDEIVRRRPVGITQVVTTVAADNGPSLAMLRRLGKATATPVGINRLDVVVEVTIPHPTDKESP